MIPEASMSLAKTASIRRKQQQTEQQQQQANWKRDEEDVEDVPWH